MSEPVHGPLRRALGLLVDLVYPPTCPACGQAFGEDGGDGRPAEPLCRDCLGQLDWIGARGCPRCAEPMAVSDREPDAAPAVCLACQTDPPVFTGAVAAAAFQGLLREMMLRFKFLPQPALARPLGQLMARALRECGPVPPNTLVVPLPLARGRRRQRGFDQARQLARRLCRELGLPGPIQALRRLRRTETQSTLDRAGRARNVAGAFVVRRAERIEGRAVILVDDVLTTGATASEAARVLLEAGARSVTVAVVGRG